MTYCAPYWISDYTYHGIATRIAAEGGSAASNMDMAVTQDHLAVFGTLAAATNEINLGTFYLVPNSTEVLGRESGDYSIRLLDAGGTILADYPFTPKSSHMDPGPVPSTCQLGSEEAEKPGLIIEFVPWVEGTARITIFQNGIELASRTGGSKLAIGHINIP